MMKSSIPSSCGLDARGAVGLGRAVVLVVVAAGVRRAAVAAASIRPPPRSARWTRCARPACSSRSRTRSTSLSATHCERPSGSVEIDDLGDVEVLRRRSSPPCRGRGRRSCPAATMPAVVAATSSSVPQRARAPRATAWPVGRVLRHDHDEAVRALARRAPPGARPARRRPPVWLASTSVTSNGRPSASRSTTTCSTGSPVSSSQALDQVAPQPARGRRAGSVETMISSMPCARDRVHRGVERVGVADLAGARRCPRRA